MTISNTNNRVRYSGDGSQTAFTANFVFFDDSDLNVYLIDSDGNQTLQTLTTDYTVSGGSGATGTVTMNSAPTSSEEVLIVRDLPMTQTTDYVENDAFPADSHEEALDRLVILVQQVQDQIDNENFQATYWTALAFAFNSSSGEETLASFTLKADDLGTNGILRLRMHLEGFGFANGATLKFNLKYGSTTVATTEMDNNTGSTLNGLNGTLEATLFGNSATNAQAGSLVAHLASSDFENSSTANQQAAAQAAGNASEDSTTDLTVSVTCQVTSGTMDGGANGRIAELVGS